MSVRSLTFTLGVFLRDYCTNTHKTLLLLLLLLLLLNCHHLDDRIVNLDIINLTISILLLVVLMKEMHNNINHTLIMYGLSLNNNHC